MTPFCVANRDMFLSGVSVKERMAIYMQGSTHKMNEVKFDRTSVNEMNDG